VSLELRIDSTTFRIQDMRAIDLYWSIISKTLTWSHWGGISTLNQNRFKIFKRTRMTWGENFLSRQYEMSSRPGVVFFFFLIMLFNSGRVIGRRRNSESGAWWDEVGEPDLLIYWQGQGFMVLRDLWGGRVLCVRHVPLYERLWLFAMWGLSINRATKSSQGISF